MNLKRRRLIVVLGMHRSGTSVVARALQVLGVDLGDNLLPPKEDNLKGFWEDADINKINIEMLNSLRSDWHCLAPLDRRAVDMLINKGFFLQATELLRKKINNKNLFGFKDPRMAVLMPFWKEVFDFCGFDVSFVLTIRHPLSVVQSLSMRDGFEFEKSFYLWLGHVISSLINSAGHKRVLVDYDCIIQSPENELSRIAHEIELESDLTSLQRYKIEFLDQKLRHTKYNLENLILEDNCPPIVREIYTELLEVALGRKQLDDLHLQNKINQWRDEFDRNYPLLKLVDRLWAQKVEAIQSSSESRLQLETLILLAHDKDVHISNLEHLRVEHKQQITALGQSVHDKDVHINNLEHLRVEYEKHITALGQSVHDKDIHINNLEHLRVEHEKQITALRQSVHDKDVHINNLEHLKVEFEMQVARSQKNTDELNNKILMIFGSTSWRITSPLRAAKQLIDDFKKMKNSKEDRHSKFDHAWYLKRNPDVAMNGMDPYKHYVLFGKAEGRRPCPEPFIIRNLNRLRVIRKAYLNTSHSILSLAKSTIRAFKTEGMEGVKIRIISLYNQKMEVRDEYLAYKNYIEYMEPNKEELDVMEAAQAAFIYKPKFSIVVPVYNVDEKWLRKFIDSVLAQIYTNWELCIADDCSAMPHVRPVLMEYAALDSRIKLTFRSTNGHISAATNSAIEMATGDFMCLMDNDDEISVNALYEFANLLQSYDEVDMIYSDEDKLDMDGNRYDPFFKPEWSPETLEGCMYTAHFACYRMSIVREIGGFRVGYEGAQDYDFVLRFTEHAKTILHIPKILYHWRAIPGSTASTMNAKEYVLDAAVRALLERAKRMNGGGEVKLGRYAGSFDLRYQIQGDPLVSIIIPSAGRKSVVRGIDVDLLANVVQSIHEKNTYRNFEIIIVDNGDLRPETIEALSAYNCNFVHFEGRFNIATKMNMGAKKAKGEYLLFMNDDIEVRSEDWMECMLQLAQRPGVGVVGAKLHFENNKIQHVGVAFWNGLPDHIRREYPELDPGHYFSSCSNRNYLAVTGAVLMTRRCTFEKLGGFDERFAINYNDIDYCLKVYESGERIVFSAGAELHHFESISRERIVADDEIILFRQKWSDLTSNDPYYSVNFEAHPPNFRLRSNWDVN